MLASYANVGLGIAFMLALLAVGVACLVWIAVWVPKRFKYVCWHEPRHVRRRAAISLAGLMLLMFCFPPLRRTGIWTEPAGNTPLPHGRSISYDRYFFGYIPTYDWIGRCYTLDPPGTSSTVSLQSDETYHLDAIRWRIDSSFLVAQLGIALLLTFPFLASRAAHQNAEIG